LRSVYRDPPLGTNDEMMHISEVLEHIITNHWNSRHLRQYPFQQCIRWIDVCSLALALINEWLDREKIKPTFLLLVLCSFILGGLFLFLHKTTQSITCIFLNTSFNLSYIYNLFLSNFALRSLSWDFPLGFIQFCRLKQLIRYTYSNSRISVQKTRITPCTSNRVFTIVDHLKSRY
jgi:hypothetical protein